MLSDDSFRALITRLQVQDPEAAAQLFQRFAQRLIGLARRRLDPVLRQKAIALVGSSCINST